MNFRMKSIIVALSVLLVSGCAQINLVGKSEQNLVPRAPDQAAPDMEQICNLIRSHDELEEGNLQSVEILKPYSKTDPIAESNRDRLRSICYAWSYNSPAPAVKDIRRNELALPKLPVVKIKKGELVFPWTDACEIASGSYNEQLGKPQMDLGGIECWQDGEGDIDFKNNSNQCQYTRYISTALDITDPSDKQDLVCYFAILDGDNDGVPDYQVSDHGRFVQNDIDVDNDGVQNIRDTDPFDPNVSGGHVCGQDGVPEHVEFPSCFNQNDAVCELQKKLYEEFDVVTVNREFSDDDPRILASLRVIYDVMNLVFKQGITKMREAQGDCPGKPTLPSFKTVSFENCPHDTLRVGDGEQQCLAYADTTGAEAIAQNGTFVVVPVGASYASLFRLGVYVHELGHLFSFAYDYGDRAYKHLVKNNFWLATGLRRTLKPMGWSIDLKEPGKRPVDIYNSRTVLNVQDHVLYDENSYKWNGVKVKNLTNMIECGVDKPDGCTYEETKRIRTGYLAYADEFQKFRSGLFTWYGAADPWEWYAEAAMAYLYRAMTAHIATRSDAVVGENIKVLFRARVLESWPENDFYFENMSDNVFRQFKRIFPMSSEQLDELVCRYVVNSDDVLFGGEWKNNPKWYDERGSYIGYFKLRERLKSEEIKSKLEEQWQEVCQNFDDLKQAINH